MTGMRRTERKGRTNSSALGANFLWKTGVIGIWAEGKVSYPNTYCPGERGLEMYGRESGGDGKGIKSEFEERLRGECIVGDVRCEGRDLRTRGRRRTMN